MRLLTGVALAAVTGTILALTLWPSPALLDRLPVACVFCGERATADALANVILFTPLGIALWWRWPTLTAPWRLGLALSLGIELLQLAIPGRDPSLGDLITNTLGTQLGWSLAHHVAQDRRRTTRGAGAYVASVAFAAIVLAGGWLLGPAATRAVYYGGWTPLLGHLEWYRGHVIAARVNDRPLAPGPLADNAPVRDFVTRGGAVVVRAIAGPPVGALAPLVSVYDEQQREILLVGPDRDALVLRYRHRAAALRLDEPDVRLENAFAGVRPGDTLVFTVERARGTACLQTGARHGCEPTATVGRGWSLVYYPESFPSWLRHALDALWLGGLALPVGWLAGLGRRLVGGGVIAIGALLAVPWVSGLAPSPLAELGAAGAGMLAGALLRYLASYPVTAAASTSTQRSMRS